MLPDLEKFEKAIDKNTCMVRKTHKNPERASLLNLSQVLASSPHYPQGTMDPIEEIAAIAVKHGMFELRF